ncbi:hypothetical protein [Microbacterium pumilum]|uniref:DUF2339 domain-containing protein n=1 Tax=Microbacterium pumilum TaxID=344165 RepID=A0ABP5DR32_9MICO
MSETTEPSAPVGRTGSFGRAVWLVIRDFLVFVLVEPVRRGRLRGYRWPRGLAPVVVVALVGYGVAAVTILAAPPLRASSALTVSTGAIDLSMPQLAVGPILALVVLALALAQTAALHSPLWLTIVVTFMSALVLLSIGANDTGDAGVLSTGRIASGLASLALVALVVIRRRRAYAWGEFVAAFAVMAAGIGVPAWIVGRRGWVFGLEPGPVVLTSMMQSIGALAIPAALAAGAAVAQLSCSMATESVASVRRHLHVAVSAVLLAGLVAWRVWAVAADVAAGDGTSIPAIAAAVTLLALVTGGWLLVGRVRATSSPPSPADLEARFSAVAQPIAAWLTIGVLPSTALFMLSGMTFSYTFADGPAGVMSTLGGLVSESIVIWGSRLAVGAVLIALALRDARRGRGVAPELYVSIGIVIVMVSALALAGLQSWAWTGEALTIIVTVAACGLLAWWLIRRRLTIGRGASIGMVLLIAALFDQRSFVEDPLRAVLGFTGIAFILFGFIWAMLTGGGTANGTSRRYPRASRVLFFLANALFGVTVLAVAALARDPSATIDLSSLTGLGDQLLGTGLLSAALLACLAIALTARAREVDSEPPAVASGTPDGR